MIQQYFITGASGFLGRAVLSELKKKKVPIRALVMKNDPLAGDLPRGISVVDGDVCNNTSLEKFFSGADSNTCVIHCAGIVSVASNPGVKLYEVNVCGTNNILRHCEKRGVGKLVYVSSVHAIPENPKGREITEDAVFSPDLVHGDYAKSKAIATALVFEAAEQGMNASVVFPSGIIGPGDSGRGSIAAMLKRFLKGRLPMAVKGGYDFVDVRDVAAGIVSCAEAGRPGCGYILSGEYATIRDILSVAKKEVNKRSCTLYLPVFLAKLIAPVYEKRSLFRKEPLFFTPCSVSVLDSNSRFSRYAATRDLGFNPRSVKSCVRDTVVWLNKNLQK